MWVYLGGGWVRTWAYLCGEVCGKVYLDGVL